MKKIESLSIPEVKVIWSKVFSDHRGHFLESYNANAYKEAGIMCDFIQDNQSYSKHAHTVRGMHFQKPPFEQAKLVRVLKGAIIDVAFDLRQGAETYYKWCSAKITAEEQNQIFVPAGFAHGFITLEPDTIVHYKVDNFYSADHDGGFIWNDPDAGIDWEQGEGDVVLSDKDQKLPGLNDLEGIF